MAKTALCQLFRLIFCHIIALQHALSEEKSEYQLFHACMASGLHLTILTQCTLVRYAVMTCSDISMSETSIDILVTMQKMPTKCWELYTKKIPHTTIPFPIYRFQTVWPIHHQA